MEEEKDLIQSQREASQLFGNTDADSGSSAHSEREQTCSLTQSCMRFRNKKWLSVEPVMFMYLLGLLLYSSVIGQYVLNRVGRDKLHELVGDTGPWDFCINASYLRERTRSESTAKEVENVASHFSLLISITSALPSFIPALLYGPISDRIGRKPILMLIGTTGCISAALSIVFVALDLSLVYFVITSVITSLGGGISGMITIAFSYIADVTPRKFLTIRLGILEAMIFLGNAVGIISGGQWLNQTGCNFVQPMFLFLACNMFIVFYVVLYLPESLSMGEREARAELSGIKGIGIIARGFMIFFIKKYSRWRLWFSLFAMFILYLLVIGVGSISTMFLFLPPLGWNAGLIAIYQSISELSVGVILIVILPLLVALQFPDTLIIILAEAAFVIVLILIGFVRTTWEMFVLGIVSGVVGLAGAPFRSAISKMVAVEDQGALFSMIAFVQVLASTFASVVFLFFYPYTLTRGWSSGTVYFLMAAIAVIPMPFVLLLLLFRNKPGAVYKEPPLPDHLRRGENEEISGADSHTRSLVQSTIPYASVDSNASVGLDLSTNADHSINTGLSFDDDDT